MEDDELRELVKGSAAELRELVEGSARELRQAIEDSAEKTRRDLTRDLTRHFGRVEVRGEFAEVRASIRALDQRLTAVEK